MPHLVLVDGHHMLYRAYWAIPRTLKKSDGELVNTVFGLGAMLFTLLAKEEPDALAICFDEGDQTFRHQEHEEYKGGRAEAPDDFYAQIPRAFELVDAFGFVRVSDPRYEADDFLAAYALAGEKAGMRVTIVSGDRDVMQLVSRNIHIAIPHKGYQQVEYLDPEGVLAKYGVTPAQVPDYKGLHGDPSDNLPGVQGIGPKTAAKLLQEHGTLEAIYEHLDTVPASVRAKLERDREQAFFCRHMAMLKDDIPLPVPLSELVLRDLSVDSLLSFLRAMEFSLLVKRFQGLLITPYGAAHYRASERDELVQETEATVQKTTQQQLSLFPSKTS